MPVTPARIAHEQLELVRRFADEVRARFKARVSEAQCPVLRRRSSLLWEAPLPLRRRTIWQKAATTNCRRMVAETTRL
jgi:hypothetical protein